MAKMPAEEYKAVMRRLFKTWHPDKAGDTDVARTIFRMLRRHEQWYRKRLAGETNEDDSWLDKDGDEKAEVEEGLALPSTVPMEAPEIATVPVQQASWFDEFEHEMMDGAAAGVQNETVTAQADAAALAAQGQAVAPAPSSPGRVVDKNQAPRWLHQGKLELLAACSLVKPPPGLRALPAAAVWHAEQAVEMAINAAMFRTCGVSEDESIGGKAHDIVTFVIRLRKAQAQTEEQSRCQEIPVSDADVEWLRRAYLNARYPKPRGEGIPAEMYSKADGERAIRIADSFLKWAGTVEDLPDPGRMEKVSDEQETTRMEGIRKRRWSELVKSSDKRMAPPTAKARPAPPAAQEPPTPKAPPVAQEPPTPKAPPAASASSAPSADAATEGDAPAKKSKTDMDELKRRLLEKKRARQAEAQ